MPAHPEVAVAVVSWNTRELLRPCLASLAADAKAGRAEVWVIDNASTDGSADLVGAEFPWARLVRSEKNLGFGGAVNLVAARTSGAWIAAANADVAVQPGAIAALLEAGSGARDVGAVAPRLRLPDGSTQHSVHQFPGLGVAVLFNSGMLGLAPALGDRLCMEGYWDPSLARWVDWAHAAFLLVRREAWDEVGGFDPEHWMYAEDLDLGWRLRRAGWLTLYEPDAVVSHALSAAASRAFAEGRSERHIAATYLWMRRARGALRARAYAALNVAGALARAGLLWPATLVAPRRFQPGRRTALHHARLHRLGFASSERLRRIGGAPADL